MFNKKLVSVLCYIGAVLLIFKTVLILTMFVWSYFGVPPVEMINSSLPQHIRALLLIQEIGVSVFLYLVVAGFYALAGGSVPKLVRKK